MKNKSKYKKKKKWDYAQISGFIVAFLGLLVAFWSLQVSNQAKEIARQANQISLNAYRSNIEPSLRIEVPSLPQKISSDSFKMKLINDGAVDLSNIEIFVHLRQLAKSENGHVVTSTHQEQQPSVKFDLLKQGDEKPVEIDGKKILEAEQVALSRWGHGNSNQVFMSLEIIYERQHDRKKFPKWHYFSFAQAENELVLVDLTRLPLPTSGKSIKQTLIEYDKNFYDQKYL